MIFYHSLVSENSVTGLGVHTRWWMYDNITLHSLCYLARVWPVDTHQLPHTLQWCHNESDSISNHQCLDCLLNLLFRRRSKKTSKLRITGLCEGNSPVTSEFPTQRTSNVENASISWCHNDMSQNCVIIGLDNGFPVLTCSMPSNYLNQWCILLNHIQETDFNDKNHQNWPIPFYWNCAYKVSPAISGPDISMNFYLPSPQKLTFFETDSIEFRRKLWLNPLAQLTVLFATAIGQWDMWSP